MVEILKIYLSLAALAFTFVAILSKSSNRSNLATIGAMITLSCLQLPDNTILGIAGLFSILLLDPNYKTRLTFRSYSISQKIGISMVFISAIVPFLYFSINYSGQIVEEPKSSDEINLFFILMTCVVLTLVLKEKNGTNK